MLLQEAAWSKVAERHVGDMQREKWTKEYQDVSLNEILAAPQLPVIGTVFWTYFKVLLYIEDKNNEMDLYHFFSLPLQQFFSLLKLCLLSSLNLVPHFPIHYKSFNGRTPVGFSILPSHQHKLRVGVYLPQLGPIHNQLNQNHWRTHWYMSMCVCVCSCNTPLVILIMSIQ